MNYTKIKTTQVKKFIPIFNEIGEVVNRNPKTIKPIKTKRNIKT